MEISRARPYFGVKTRHGFEIVVENVGPGRDDGFERSLLAQKIGGQHLDGRARGSGADRRNGSGELSGAAIVKVVAVDRGDDDMGERECGDRRADTFGLMRVDKIRPAGGDVAKGAGAGADLPEDHHRRVFLFPTLADIRAGRFLAHGIEPKLAHQPPRRLVFGRARRPDSQPIGLARDRTVGIARLFRMAESCFDCHSSSTVLLRRDEEVHFIGG